MKKSALMVSFWSDTRDEQTLAFVLLFISLKKKTSCAICIFLFRLFIYQAHEPPATSPVPDLRVDFFSEPIDHLQKRHSYVEITMKQISASDMSPSMSSTNISISNAGNTSGINVTSNPMDDTSATVTCTTQTPRATIVVQQVITL